jgi:dUTP pyrophosphatase
MVCTNIETYIDMINQEDNEPRGFEAVNGKVEGLNIPQRKTKNSAGYDFVMPYQVSIPPHKATTIFTGIKAYMPKDECLLLMIRSSLAMKEELRLANGIGLIDADYYGNIDNDGEICAKIINDGDKTRTLLMGERFMQGVFTRFYTCGDTPKEERSGGVGSTGK